MKLSEKICGSYLRKGLPAGEGPPRSPLADSGHPAVPRGRRIGYGEVLSQPSYHFVEPGHQYVELGEFPGRARGLGLKIGICNCLQTYRAPRASEQQPTCGGAATDGDALEAATKMPATTVGWGVATEGGDPEATPNPR